jgi:hypothetical protein
MKNYRLYLHNILSLFHIIFRFTFFKRKIITLRKIIFSYYSLTNHLENKNQCRMFPMFLLFNIFLAFLIQIIQAQNENPKIEPTTKNLNKFVCKIIDSYQTKNLNIECKYDHEMYCRDPSDDILEDMFARTEFHLLNSINLAIGSKENEMELNKFPKLNKTNSDEVEVASYGRSMKDCNYNDFRAEHTRSICPWNEKVYYRDNLYPNLRRFSECNKSCGDHCKNIKVVSFGDGKHVHHKCQELSKLELVLYRGECVNQEYEWNVGLEYIPYACSCMKEYK